MRIISEEVYGIPPENVIGSHGSTVFESRNGKGAILRKPGNIVANDRAGKPVGIDLHIGRRPSLQIMINHDDPTREYAYAEKDNVSLNAAKKNGWQIVSMKNDWRRIFQDPQR